MTDRDKELLEQAGVGDNWNKADWYSMSPKMIEAFADLIRADERENFVAFIQEYPHWLGDNAKQEIIAAIRARGEQ
jgi:hypothetical protein